MKEINQYEKALIEVIDLVPVDVIVCSVYEDEGEEEQEPGTE